MVGQYDRRKLHHALVVMTRLQVWQLAVILVLSFFLALTFLRLNNIGMIERRQAVIEADASGDEVEIKRTLADLQHYVSRHMNTDLGNGVYLVETYQRDRAEALRQASDTPTNPNSSVYQQASIECRSRFQGGVESFRNDYVQCVVDRVQQLQPASDPLADLRLPLADNYRYDFVSPRWSADLAGFVLLGCALLLLVIIGRISGVILIKLMLRRRYHVVSGS